MNIMTTNAPPTYGTTTMTWEGFIRADEILPGDLIVPEGHVENIVPHHGAGEQEIILLNGLHDFYNNDEMLYVERTVKVTIAEAD